MGVAVRYRRIYAKPNRDGSVSTFSGGPVGTAAILTWRSVVGRFLAIGIALCFLTPFGVGSQATAVWAIVGAAVLTIVDAIWRLDRRQKAGESQAAATRKIS